MEKIRIEITDADIEFSIPDDCENCIVARAVQRVLNAAPSTTSADYVNEYVRIWSDGQEYRVTEEHEWSVSQMMRDFDGVQVYPEDYDCESNYMDDYIDEAREMAFEQYMEFEFDIVKFEGERA